MSEETYNQICHILGDSHNDLIFLLKKMLIELKRINCKYLSQNQSLILEKPSFRIKSPESLSEKLDRKRINVDQILIEIKDILGIRVICLDLMSLDKIAEELHSSTIIEILKEKRWLETADSDGYRGIHLIVTLKNKSDLSNSNIKAEIQIRTVAQHFWASFSHRDLYKTERLLLPQTNDRVRALSETLYFAECEVQRLAADIHNDPLKINGPNLNSLFKTLKIHIQTPDLGIFLKGLAMYGFGNMTIPELQIALTSKKNLEHIDISEIETWSTNVAEKLNINSLDLVDIKLIRIIAHQNGNFWPKRRILELLLSIKADQWLKILGSDDPKDLLILLEASQKGEIEKFTFTWHIPGRSSMTWSTIINRDTTKRLSDLNLINVKLENSIQKKEVNEGIAEKHRHLISCTPHGRSISSKIIQSLFKNSNDLNTLLNDIEIEDFPREWKIMTTTSSIKVIPADNGPTIVEKDWWSEQIGYY